MSALPSLSAAEARIVAVLSEKQRTVPDTYPLSLNALVAGCNQKTSRDPVMEISEAEAATAIDNLKSLSLVVESSGGRVARYSHNLDRVLQVPSQSVAILTTLMLRGPQTAGELRINCERLHRFADISAVEGFLNELAERSSGALVMELPRQPGSRENRWAHLLSGTPEINQLSTPSTPAAAGGELAELRSRVTVLEDELAQLRAIVSRLNQELGLPD
ncbi:YceH family protein [Chitinivorax sp. PXF-14]|uniref:YceH family protein n=1 Tax=Chitinivorax sp. PXF-14 TaxID=3230488 RepID=UPI003466FC7B